MKLMFPPQIPIPPSNPIEVVKKIVETGKKIWRFIKGDDVKDKKPMNQKDNTVDEIVELNAMLHAYRENISQQTRGLESDVKELCRGIFGQVVESVEFANSQFQFYRIESLERKIENYMEDIDGIFEKNVAKRISLDDDECVSVLKMLPGELKGKRMEELRQRVFRESITDLCRKVEDFQKDLFDSMEMTVDAKMCSIEEKLMEKTEIFNVLSSETNNLETEKERNCVKAAYKLALVGIFEQMIGSEE